MLAHMIATPVTTQIHAQVAPIQTKESQTLIHQGVFPEKDTTKPMKPTLEVVHPSARSVYHMIYALSVRIHLILWKMASANTIMIILF